MTFYFFFILFSTFKKDCPAEIRLSVGKDGCMLKVVSFQGTHNHECNEVRQILRYNAYCIVNYLLQLYDSKPTNFYKQLFDFKLVLGKFQVLHPKLIVSILLCRFPLLIYHSNVD